MLLLEAQTTVVVVAAVGVVVGSVVLVLLLPLGRTSGALATAGVLGLGAVGLAWWSTASSSCWRERPQSIKWRMPSRRDDGKYDDEAP